MGRSGKASAIERRGPRKGVMAEKATAVEGRRWKPNFEIILALVLVVEVVIFSRTGSNFATVGNVFEILRLSAEIGLLALVMTPIILTGGIDLSVGSLLGLSCILFGKLLQDCAWPLWLAVGATLGLAAMGGALNGLFITRLKIPPLIVTLATFSLFRGLAEAITGGVRNFTDFPASFLYLGQGYFLGLVPAQAPILLAAAVIIGLLVHQTTFGRSLNMIGFSAEGAQYAGIPVRWRLFTVYTMSGLAAGVASLVYAARVGQAKADAGTGYELLAITAVVLGGASIFGGSGTVIGTLLGVAVLAVLKVGLTLSDMPGELAGILTGGLLLTVLTVEAVAVKISARRARAF
jgi:rhamnose transport system permease protein